MNEALITYEMKNNNTEISMKKAGQTAESTIQQSQAQASKLASYHSKRKSGFTVLQTTKSEEN